MALDSQFGGNPRQGVQESPPPPYVAVGSPSPGALVIDVNDLPLADPAEPLFECIIPIATVFTGVDFITAGVAATGVTVFRLFKNGAANGNITVTGSAGVASFTSASYAAGDLFGLFPPLAADATLDRVRITLGTD